MRRIPVVATLVVAAAMAAMIALGVWQLKRAEEKAGMLAEFRAARQLPPLDLDLLMQAGGRRLEHDPPFDFRRVTVTCYPSSERAPEVRAGRSRAGGQPGSGYFIPCFWDEAYGWPQHLQVNVGWANRPTLRPALPGGRGGWKVEGMIGEVRPGRRIILTADRPLAPLASSAFPSPEDIPNNHLFYAFQWFFFAASAMVIYVLALRRRLSADARVPKSPRS